MSSQIEHWDRLASCPPDASVIDPQDKRGDKNRYIAELRNAAIVESLQGADQGYPVLDFGCGTGGLSTALAQHGYSAIGVDISPGLLGRTPERGLGDRVLFLRFDGSHLPIIDGCMSAAVTYVVLNHIMDDGQLKGVLREIARALKPGGKLIAIEQVRRRPTINAVVWQHRRTIVGFETLFRDAGFTMRSSTVVRYGRLPTTYALRAGLVPRRWFPKLRAFEKRLGAALGVLPWDYCDVRFEAIKA